MSTELVPARIVNEFVYCPRLAYLEWVQGEWADSADTIEGAAKHRRVDRKATPLPRATDLQQGETIHARSVSLSSITLGASAKVDLIEADGNETVPVDYKRGKRPHIAKGAYDPERVQLCLQGLLLEEAGYQVTHGVLYFVASRERVKIEFDDELRQRTLDSLRALRDTVATDRIPPPLEDSPKCPRCSLVGICLPDEVNHLARSQEEPRPIAVPREESLPLYVQARSAKVAKSGERLIISVDDEVISHARLRDTSQVVLMGSVYVTTGALHELMRREIPISWYSFGGWFLGHTVGVGHKNVEVRTAQYQRSFQPEFCLRLAQELVRTKILNCRTLLRRNWRDGAAPKALLTEMKRDAESAASATSLESLLGVEGSAAARYFRHFRNALRQPGGDQDAQLDFDFAGRNRRPARDAVNALLSFAYALLVRVWSVSLSGVGLDPYRGFYHQPRYGRPALSLDMMEPFRPIIADSIVITAINNGEVRPGDFVRAAGAVTLSDEGRKRFIGVFERRLAQEITHPLFGYRVSYRRLMHVQARLLSRYLLGELTTYPSMVVR